MKRMRLQPTPFGRLLLVCAALAAMLAVGVAVASGSSITRAVTARHAKAAAGHDADSSAPRDVLSGLVCQTALDPPDRAISVTAVMRPVTGTQQMQIEFQLFTKTPAATSWTQVTGNGLGAWLTPSNPTLGQRPGDVWKVSHPVATCPLRRSIALPSTSAGSAPTTRSSRPPP